MRTALCEMHLLIDNMIMHDRVYICNQNFVGREQNSQETERESVCVRDSALPKMRDGVGNKFDH